MHSLKSQNVIQMPSTNRAPGSAVQPQRASVAAGLGAPPPQPQRDASIGTAGAGATPALVPFPRWQKARDRATAAVLAGERRLLVTGPAGAGKTLLLEHVARTLRAAGWEAAVRLADADPQPPAQGGSIALLVDEADHLPAEALQRLLQGTSGPLVLAGLETLERRVPPSATRIALTALDFEEARDYIAQWLALTGRTPAHLATAAMRRVVELSAGVPRLLSTLLGASAWLAESEGAAVISVQHVNDAGALRSCLGGWDDGPGWDAATEPEQVAAPPAAPARRMPAYAPALAAMLVFGAGSFLAARTWPTEAQQTVQLARGYAAQLAAEARARLAVEPFQSADAAVPTPAQIAAAPEPPAAAAEPPAPIATASIAEPPPATPQPAAPEPAAPEPAVAEAATVEPAIAADPAPAGSLDTAPWTGPAEVATASTAPEPPAPAQPAAPAPSATEPTAALPASAVVASPAQPAPQDELPAGLVEMLLKRGHEMLALGDISAARLLFGRAAEAGSADAMLAMGRTFDPVALTGANSLLTPDPAEAAHWYRRAAAAGSTEAAGLLQRVGRQAAR